MWNFLSSTLTRLLFYITLPRNVDILFSRVISVENKEEGNKIKKEKHKKKKRGEGKWGNVLSSTLIRSLLFITLPKMWTPSSQGIFLW